MTLARTVRRSRGLVACAFGMLGAPITFAGPATFLPLGDLAGGDVFSFAMALSGDGGTVAGQSTSAQWGQAVRWTGGAIDGLGTLPGLQLSAASGSSSDGNVIVGSAGTGVWASGKMAVSWSGGAASALGDLFGGLAMSEAWGVSADGLVIVGRSNSEAGMEAFRWRVTDGLQPLGDFLGGAFDSEARACSADGRATSANGVEAFRWTQENGLVGLDDLPGGEFNSVAYDCSLDGNVIVGLARSDNGDEAFRWTQGGGMVALGDLPGGDFSAIAAACSADGSVIVGSSMGASSNQAFIWTQSQGMRALQDVLTNDHAIDLAGWQLNNATGISDDGLTITGYGVNPSGLHEAFLVRLPGPSVAPRPGDVNADGVVNGRDLSVMLAEFGNSPVVGGADVNGDLSVTGQDLSVLLASINADE